MEVPNFKVLGISHLGIAAKNPEMFSLFMKLLGLEHTGEEVVAEQKTQTQFFSFPSHTETHEQNSKGGRQDPRIESLIPSPAGAGPIFQFLEKKGGGIHHIALRVDNLENALRYLEEKKITLIDKTPRLGAGGHKIAFIHPHATGGILVELCE